MRTRKIFSPLPKSCEIAKVNKRVKHRRTRRTKRQTGLNKSSKRNETESKVRRSKVS